MKAWKEAVVLAVSVLTFGGMVGGCATGAPTTTAEPVAKSDESVQLFAILREEGHRAPALQDLRLQGAYLP